MAFTTAGLKNGGDTTHYHFEYDGSLQATAANPGGPEPARTNDVIDNCEADFALMSRWFGNTALDVDFKIPVNVTPNDSGGAWGKSGRALTVTINPGSSGANHIRYLLVSEMVEQFMRAHGRNWFGDGTEGSEGEGLSRFLAAQMLALNGLGNPRSDFYNSNTWLKSAREDYVTKIEPKDDGPSAPTGCSLLFIYFLFAQLGFSIEQIVAAGATLPSDVYRNLTSDPANPFPFFRHLADTVLPGTATITTGNRDNPFPILLLFVLGQDGMIRTALRDGAGWHWSTVEGGAFNHGNPITAIRGGSAIDIFVLGTDGMVRTAWRDGAGWHWKRIEGAQFHQGNPITATRYGDALDIFVLGQDGVVRSAYRDDDWHWSVAGGARFRQGAPITAARSGNELDIFVLGEDGMVRTAYRDGFGWHWNVIDGAQFHQGNPITALRSGNELDIFVLGQDGMVRTAYRGDRGGWYWSRIEGAQFHQGNAITAVRSGNELDIFVLGQDGVVRTAYRGDHGNWYWSTVTGARFHQGSPIRAVRSGNAMDIFVLGEDNMVRTAFRDGARNWNWSVVQGAAFRQDDPITVYGN
jgi:hypothetical protein